MRRVLSAIGRLLRRYRGKVRKRYLTAKPHTLFLARHRQLSAERFFEGDFQQRLSALNTPRASHPEIKLAFAHVPKCGGTSLHFWLRDELGLKKLNSVPLLNEALRSTPFPPVVSFGHMSVDAVIARGYLPRESLDRAFTFSLVRNPFTRALSLFSHFQVIGQIPENWSLNRFLRLVQRSDPGVGFFNLARLSQAAPQTRWIRQQQWSGPSLIVPLENPAVLEDQLQKRFDVSSPMLSIRHSGSSRFLDQWDDTSTALVQEIYRDDFHHFGYDPEVLPWSESA